MLGGNKFFNKLKDIQKMKSKSVEVGFFPDSGRYEDGSTVAQVAAKNEYGGQGSVGIIPARPFMTKSAQDSSGILAKEFLENELKIEETLTSVGKKVQEVIQGNIVEWSSPPNSAMTIEKKGFDDPLIDTGKMFDSVDYKIGSKNES